MKSSISFHFECREHFTAVLAIPVTFSTIDITDNFHITLQVLPVSQSIIYVYQCRKLLGPPLVLAI